MEDANKSTRGENVSWSLDMENLNVCSNSPSDDFEQSLYLNQRNIFVRPKKETEAK